MRSTTIDVIRGAACIMILLYHIYFSRIIGLGQSAMEVFFVISGYLISRSLNKSLNTNGLIGIKRFALRRIMRLQPAILVFTVATILLNLTINEISYTTLAFSSLFTVTGGYNFYQVYHQPKVIGLAGIWSLSLEEQFYLAAILFFITSRALGLRSASRLLTFSATLAICGLYFRIAAYLGHYNPGDDSHISYLPPLRLWAFGLGSFIAFLETQPSICSTNNKISRKALIITLISSIIGIASLIATVTEYTARTFMFQWAAVPILAAVIIWLNPGLDKLGAYFNRSTNNVLLHGLSFLITGIKIIGLASYSIYLWHALVIAFFSRYNINNLHFSKLYMTMLSISIGIISWQLIEKRFYNFGTQKKQQSVKA